MTTTNLLEAAAMGRPIVATPRVLEGLAGTPPIPGIADPGMFADCLLSMWLDPTRTVKLGLAARKWVQESHTWEAAATVAAAGLRDSIRVSGDATGVPRPPVGRTANRESVVVERPS